MTTGQDTEAKRIKKLLDKALLHNSEMSKALYEFEMVEHIDYWYKGLKRNHEQFVFVVTENRNHVAMVLITADKTVYVNEEAREKLQDLWTLTYTPNMKQVIPAIANDLANGELLANGVKVANA